MIIEWTYGIYAQHQRYFGLSFVDTISASTTVYRDAGGSWFRLDAEEWRRKEKIKQRILRDDEEILKMIEKILPFL